MQDPGSVRVELVMKDPINAGETVWAADRKIHLNCGRILEDNVVVKCAFGSPDMENLWAEGRIYKEKLNALQQPVAPMCHDFFCDRYADDMGAAILILDYGEPCENVKKFVCSPSRSQFLIR
jgi:hypothetical protein